MLKPINVLEGDWQKQQEIKKEVMQLLKRHNLTYGTAQTILQSVMEEIAALSASGILR